MKRTQSLEFFLSPKTKIIAVEDKLVVDRPSPAVISELSPMVTPDPASEINAFHHRFQSILKDIVEISLHRIKISSMMTMVALGPVPEDLSFPVFSLDFLTLTQMFQQKLDDYQLLISQSPEKKRKIDFLKFLYNLESKALWVELLGLDYIERLRKVTELTQSKLEKPASSASANELFFYYLTQHSDEKKKHYQKLLLLEDAKLTMVQHYLLNPGLVLLAIKDLNNQFESKKQKLTLDLYGLYQALKLQDENCLKQLVSLSNDFFALIETYPKELVFDESWLDVNRQLFDNIHTFLHTVNLIDILAIEAELRCRPMWVEVETQDESGGFDCIVDFTDSCSKDEYYMKVQHQTVCGYFHGEFSHLMTLNYILSAISEKQDCFTVDSVQKNKPLL